MWPSFDFLRKRRLLAALSKGGERTPLELARATGISLPAVYPLLSELERCREVEARIISRDGCLHESYRLPSPTLVFDKDAS